MNTSSFRAAEYLHYITKRKTIQYIHSPFLFSLMQEVFSDKNDPGSFKKIESIRRELSKSGRVIEFEDMGAGGDVERTKTRSVGNIARQSVKQAKYGRFLYRLAKFMKASSLVELGTSLGLTTLYLSDSAENGQVYSIEGDKNICAFANEVWKSGGTTSIHSFCFDLNEGWPQLAGHIGRIDFLFVDANHRKEAMIRYVLQALPYLHERSVVIMDDIRWNEETLEAWNLLKDRREVTLSFDIFQMGVLFFSKDLSKEHFILKY